jgi:hypothetical protein
MENPKIVSKVSMEQLRLLLQVRLGQPVSEEECEEVVIKYALKNITEIENQIQKKKINNKMRLHEWMLSGDGFDYDSDDRRTIQPR